MIRNPYQPHPRLKFAVISNFLARINRHSIRPAHISAEQKLKFVNLKKGERFYRFGGFTARSFAFQTFSRHLPSASSPCRVLPGLESSGADLFYRACAVARGWLERPHSSFEFSPSSATSTEVCCRTSALLIPQRELNFRPSWRHAKL